MTLPRAAALSPTAGNRAADGCATAGKREWPAPVRRCLLQMGKRNREYQSLVERIQWRLLLVAKRAMRLQSGA